MYRCYNTTLKSPLPWTTHATNSCHCRACSYELMYSQQSKDSVQCSAGRLNSARILLVSKQTYQFTQIDSHAELHSRLTLLCLRHSTKFTSCRLAHTCMLAEILPASISMQASHKNPRIHCMRASIANDCIHIEIVVHCRPSNMQTKTSILASSSA